MEKAIVAANGRKSNRNQPKVKLSQAGTCGGIPIKLQTSPSARARRSTARQPITAMNVPKADELAAVSGLGNSLVEVDVVVKVDERVKIHDVDPATSPTCFASNSPNGNNTGTVGLRAWLAASKVSVALHVRDVHNTEVRCFSRYDELCFEASHITAAATATCGCPPPTALCTYSHRLPLQRRKPTSARPRDEFHGCRRPPMTSTSLTLPATPRAKPVAVKAVVAVVMIVQETKRDPPRTSLVTARNPREASAILVSYTACHWWVNATHA